MKAKLIIFLIVVVVISSLTILSGNSTNVSASEPKISFVRGDSVFSWESMSFDARKDYMKKVVLPTMKEKFVAFDSTRFTAMNCRTCHGSGVKDGTFKMPNERLPKLNMNFSEMAHDNPHYMQFMGEVVKPQVAALLGVLPLNHETQTGTFGCQSCHMFEEEKK